MSADQTRQTQARVLRAKVVDAAEQESACREAFRLAPQAPRVPRQTAQATAKGTIQPLNVGSIDVARALRLLDERGDSSLRALINAPREPTNATSFVLFDDLCDQQVGPLDEAWTPFLRARFRFAEDGFDLRRIARQAVGTKEPGPIQRGSGAFDPPSSRPMKAALRCGLTSAPSHKRVCTWMAMANQSTAPSALTRNSSHCTWPSTRGCSTKCSCTT